MAKPSGVSLGFVGSGEVKVKTTEKLLVDLLEAEGGPIKIYIPLTEESWNDGYEWLGEYVLRAQAPYEVVTTSEARGGTKFRKLMEGASKIHVMVKVSPKIVGLLEKAQNPRLMVFWNDEDEEACRAVDSALNKEIPVHDLCDGMVRLTFNKEDNKVPEEEKPYTKEELLELVESNEDGVRELCAQADIDPDQIQTWEEVVDLLLKFQSEEDDSVESTSDDAEPEPYTRKELEGMELTDLKDICKVNEIEVPPRSRTATYIEAILDAQESSAKEAPKEAPAKDEAPRQESVRTGLSAEDLDTLKLSFNGVLDVLQSLSEAIEEGFKAISKKLDSLHSADGAGKPSERVAKALGSREAVDGSASTGGGSTGSSRPIRRVR